MLRTPRTIKRRPCLAILLACIISITLHSAVWYAWQDASVEPPKPIKPPPETIEVALMAAPKSKSAQAVSPSVVKPHEPPKPEKPKPQKAKKAKSQVKPKPKLANEPKLIEKAVNKPAPIKPVTPHPIAQSAATSSNYAPSNVKSTATAPASVPKTKALVKAVYSSPSLKNPPTHYPRMAQARQWEGTVALEIQVLANGTAGEVKVIRSSSHSVLDESAVEQIKAWHFIPARKGNRTVDDWVRLSISFKFED